MTEPAGTLLKLSSHFTDMTLSLHTTPPSSFFNLIFFYNLLTLLFGSLEISINLFFFAREQMTLFETSLKSVALEHPSDQQTETNPIYEKLFWISCSVSFPLSLLVNHNWFIKSS